MYCLKCKRKTESADVKRTISKNGKEILQGVCNICGCKKSSFISSNKKGKGLGNVIVKAIGNLGELHLPANQGEYVPNGSFNYQINIHFVDLVQNMNKEIMKVIRESMNWTKCVNSMINFIMKIMIQRVEM